MSISVTSSESQAPTLDLTDVELQGGILDLTDPNGSMLVVETSETTTPATHAMPEIPALAATAVAEPPVTNRYGGQPVSKTLLDVIFSAITVALLSPLMLIIGLLVKLTSRGPMIYSQTRVGLDGQLFTIHKFRTMTDGADHHLRDLLLHHGRHDEPLFKVPNDPRITKLGKVLRKLSLDELPQFFDVLTGAMSLVGPRPQRPAEVALYSNIERRRLTVKPGVTGAWQVEGRSSMAWNEAVQLDIAYAATRSTSTDFKILARTVLVVLSSRGAV